MKSNYLSSRGDFNSASREIARQEIEKYKKTVCVSCEQNIANQVAAVMCKALSVRYGFGKQRLQQIITDTENLFELCAVDGKRFNAVQAVEWLKLIGIDLERDANADRSDRR
jgi:hypothetical protein